MAAQQARILSTVCPDAGFEQFYDQLQPHLLAYSLRLFGADDAEEITSETMARALEHFSEFDQGRAAWPWLLVVARRVACDLHRAKRRAVCTPTTDDVFTCIPDEARPPEDHSIAIERARIFDQAMGQLTERDRQILRLRAVDGMSHHEIAALFGTSTIAARQQFHRVRIRFLSGFTALGGELRGLLPLPFLIAFGQRIRRATMPVVMTAPRMLQAAGALSALMVGPAGMALASTSATPATPAGVAFVLSADASPVLADDRGPRGANHIYLSASSSSTVRSTPPRFTEVKAEAGSAGAVVRVGGNPFAAGKTQEHRVAVNTPVGTLYLEGEAGNSGRNRVVCQLPVVNCE